MIEYRNGYKMPKIGLGTFRMTDAEQTYDIILKAIETGYRHFDTAQMYGNEEVVGKAIKDSGIKRKDVFITTKLQGHHSPLITRELILESMKKLQVEYLDQLLIHWPNHDNEINVQTWKVFEELYNEGLVKVIGVSNFTRYQLEMLIKDISIPPMSNQVEMHPALSQEPLRAYCEDKGIKITSYGPLMRGLILEEPYYSGLNEIAIKHNSTVGAIAIAWGLSQGVMMIPKTSTDKRLAENLSAKDIKLSNDEITKINAMNTGRRLYSDPSNNIYGKYIK
ncbi:aldo/keto reductase [Haploplasma axanthum]|uniref:Glyoxal reductase n=1 Tax=Haploplasma axanthum TaxID=29552 RepID=A0A449BEA7_HAPAX|nr:aldo/keto reductase [Haploplasma axanthum]VEU80762.1 Glyoxal reductase [Haploplasma axanthum]